jgi:hypothetical protein
LFLSAIACATDSGKILNLLPIIGIAFVLKLLKRNEENLAIVLARTLVIQLRKRTYRQPYPGGEPNLCNKL